MKRLYGQAVAAAVAVFFVTVSSATNLGNSIQTGSHRSTHEELLSVQYLAGNSPGPHAYQAPNQPRLAASGQSAERQATRLAGLLLDGDVIPSSGGAAGGSVQVAQANPVAEETEAGQSAAETEPETSDQQPVKPVFDESEKLSAQSALAWFGDYHGAIDGIFGRGTRAAVQAFQRRNSIVSTGQLTRGQFDLLIHQHNAEIEETGFRTVEHEPAGISIGIPTTMVEFARTEVPFIYYDPTPGNRLQLFLISMPGSRITLEALYSLFQGFEFMPEGGDRSLGRHRFSLQAANEQLTVYADVRLLEHRVKGFLLLWHPDFDPLMTRMSRSMSIGFEESSESTFSIPAGSDHRESNSFFADLKIPRPKSRHSGFFIDMAGTVATSSVVADACSYVMLAPDQKMTVAAASPVDGVALLTPVEVQVPLAHARFQPSPISNGAQITLSGYSFGGELGAPSQSRGRWIGKDPTADDAERYLVDVESYPGDVGGPVLDKTGAVVGMLRDQDLEGKTLPDGVQPLTPARAIASLATTIARPAMYAFSGGKLDPTDLNRLASDMTVLIDCFAE